MKNTLTLLLGWILLLSANAQKEFTRIYEVKSPVEVDTWYCRSDRGLIVAGNDAALMAMDGVTGKILWQIDCKSLVGIKKSQDWEYQEDIAAVKLEFKGDKKTGDRVVYLDEATGKIIESDVTKRSSASQKGTHLSLFNLPKKEWLGREVLNVEGRDLQLRLSYESPVLNSSFKRDKKMPIEVTCSGEYNWTSDISGNFVRSLCDNGGNFGVEFGDFITLHVDGNIVFVIYEGISALDLKTGKLLWETPFAYTLFDFGMAKHEMVIGRAPMPLVDGNSVYIADLGKDSRCIKKIEASSGSILWQSQKLDKDAIITQMLLVNGALLVRNGGRVVKQELIMDLNTGNYVKCITKEENEGDFSLTAYDASSGKPLWEGKSVKELGDKFKNISNLLTDGQSVYVCSDKQLFALAPKTGIPSSHWDIASLKLGSIDALTYYHDDLLVHGEKGIARFAKNESQAKYATQCGKNLGEFFRGNAFYIYTGENEEELNEFIRFNLENGTIEGKIKDTPYPKFTPDGNEFVKKKDQVFYRYKTN